MCGYTQRIFVGGNTRQRTYYIIYKPIQYTYIYIDSHRKILYYYMMLLCVLEC